MEGPDHTSEEHKGVIPRMIDTIFNDVLSADANIEFNITVCYFEIYMEKIRDLLNPAQDNMMVREHPQKGIWVDGATEASVVSPDEVFTIMAEGAKSRATAATNMNDRSSRSHSLFLLTVSQTNLVDLSKKSGKLYLVDLAGSEKAGKTGAEGAKLDEAKTINKSLTSLGLVITKLTKGEEHIPYRDSKLTRVLTESLGGNAKTSLIIACSPAVYNESETRGTLEFGVRAKMIKNKAKINREQSIPELKALVAKLEKKIQMQQKKIRQLEGIISENGLEVPKEVAAGGPDEDVEEEPSMSHGRRASLESSNLEMTKQHAVLQEKCDDLEQKLIAETEEKEFMKSLMDDLLEQLAQKENEKKMLQDQQEMTESESLELKSRESDVSAENNVLVQKLAELTQKLELAEAAQKASAAVLGNTANIGSEGLDETWAKKEEELKKSVLESEQKMANMEEQLKDDKEAEKAAEESAETKARIAELEGMVTSLEKGRDELRGEIKDLRESGGASSAVLADAATMEGLRDDLQKSQSELERKSVLLQEREADWRREKDGYLKLHRSLEGQLGDLKEQLAKQGHEYEELKVSLMKDLQNRCEKVVELQINLDEARENYHRLLQNSNHRVLSRKVLYLERSLETLKAAYQESVSQKSTLRIDKQVAEKKCEQKEREIKSLEMSIRELKEDNRSLKLQLGTGSAYDNYMSMTQDLPRVGVRGGGGTVKTLRGGGIRGGGGGVRGGGASPAMGMPGEDAEGQEAAEAEEAP